MKILVTGGAGFIGSNLIDRLLELNYEVICIDNFDSFYSESIKINNINSANKNKNFSLIRCDIRDQKSLEKCFNETEIELVIHLAAKAGVRPSIESPIECFDVNVNGTLMILEAMKKHHISKMIFASSSSVYGNNKKTPFSEADLVDNPISPYAASKRACELLCHTYHHLNNFDIFCLRFFTVFGPRQRPDLAIHKFTNNIIDDQEITMFGDGSSKRDYTYVDDIIDGIINSINHLKGYEIINLGESNTISLKQMISTIETHLEKKANIKLYPMPDGDVKITYADITKAKKLINYSPKWDFEKGIIEFIKWKKR